MSCHVVCLQVGRNSSAQLAHVRISARRPLGSAGVLLLSSSSYDVVDGDPRRRSSGAMGTTAAKCRACTLARFFKSVALMTWPGPSRSVPRFLRRSPLLLPSSFEAWLILLSWASSISSIVSFFLSLSYLCPYLPIRTRAALARLLPPRLSLRLVTLRLHVCAWVRICIFIYLCGRVCTGTCLHYTLLQNMFHAFIFIALNKVAIDKRSTSLLSRCPYPQQLYY